MDVAATLIEEVRHVFPDAVPICWFGGTDTNSAFIELNGKGVAVHGRDGNSYTVAVYSDVDGFDLEADPEVTLCSINGVEFPHDPALMGSLMRTIAMMVARV